MRRQMPRLRQLRAPHDPRPHLRRMLLWQLPKQMRRVRWRGKSSFFSLFTLTGGITIEADDAVWGTGHLGRVLLLRVYAVGEGSGWVPEDYQSGEFEDGSVLPEEEF